VFKGQNFWRIFGLWEALAVVLTLFLLPIDRFPYLHYVPLKLGAISFILLLSAAGVRLAEAAYDKDSVALKRIAIAAGLLLLPVIGYAQSIHYAIDKPLAKGATRLLFIAVLKALCFFILLGQNPALWRPVKRIIYIVTAVIVAFGFFQFALDVVGVSTKATDLRSCCTSNSTYVFPRVQSVALEPLYFANFLLIPIWLMIYDFIFDKLSRQNKWLIGLFLATSSLFVLSLARSAMLGLLISAIVFFAAIKGKGLVRRSTPFLLKIIGGVLIVVLVSVVLSGFASKHIHKTAINGSSAGVSGNIGIFSGHAVAVADQSAQTRYSTWPKAITYVKEKPLKGIGAYNSRVRLNLASYRKGTPDTQLQPFNNDLLGLLVDLGLIGILTFGPILAGVLTSLLKSFKKIWSTQSAPYALACLAMLIQSNFFQSILLARLWVVVGIVLTGLFTDPVRKKSR
jgi:O-antigen ligase